MPGLPEVPKAERLRTRRWDAVVLGGALPGLISAVRIGMSGARTLVLEEDAAVRGYAGLREPFLMAGAEPGGVLAHCLQEIGIALIDRRRFDSDGLAYQVVLPDARVDVGEPSWTVEELDAWKLAAPDDSRELVRSLLNAAAAEREAMLAAPIVRGWRRIPVPGRGTRRSTTSLPTPAARTPRRERGLPAAVVEAQGRLAPLLAAQVRALSNLGSAVPSPEAQARLLGLPLESAAIFSGGDRGFRAMLRRRIRSLHGEFRTIPGRFRLVAVAGQPGVALEETEEIAVGRALVLNAPRRSLADAVTQDPPPDLLHGPPPARRRVALHFRAARRVVPSGMGSRVVSVRDAEAPMDGTNVVTLRLFPDRHDETRVDLVAAAIVPADEPDLGAREDEIEAAVRRLMPFSEEKLVRVPGSRARWDGDEWLCDPAPGSGWPSDTQMRLSAKPPTYVLDRAGVAGLGFEGDVLLGWRAGDALAAELA